MLTVNAYAAHSATAPPRPDTVERRDLGPHDVLINILCGGVDPIVRGEHLVLPLLACAKSPFGRWIDVRRPAGLFRG